MRAGLAGWVVLQLLFAVAQDAAAAAPRYLVAVGHNHGRGGETPLQYAERDAAELAALLMRLGGVAADRAIVSLGEDADAVRSALRGVSARIALAQASEPEAMLIVYYSGHADANGLHLGGTTLPYDELRQLVRDSPATLRVLVLDGCRSGGLTRVKGMEDAASFDVVVEQQRLEAEGLAIITSSAAGEDSHESERLRGSFFTHHLMNALRGAADHDRDGRVTLDEAYAYAYHQTLRSSGQTLTLQHPTYEVDVRGRGGLALTEVGAAGRGQGTLALPEAGLWLVMEGRDGGPVVSELAVAEGGTQVTLPPGRYFVQHRQRDAYRDYDVRLGPGGALDLAGEPYQTVAYARLLRKGGGERAAIFGLSVLGGAHGPLLDGFDPSAQALVAFTVDFSWLTVGLRGRFANAVGESGGMSSTHRQYGGALVLQRMIDGPWLSLGVGLLVEGTRHEQRFRLAGGETPARGSWGLGFGGFLALERTLVPALSLRVEGGPVTQLFERETTAGGAPTGETTTATPLTWHVAGGVLWQF